MSWSANVHVKQLLDEIDQLKADNAALRQTRADLSREGNKLESERDEARAELARRDAAAGEPFCTVFVGCIGADKYHFDITGKLPDGIYPLHTTAQPALLPPEIPMGVTDGVRHGILNGHPINPHRADGWNSCIQAAKALGCQLEKVVKLPDEKFCPAEYQGSLLWSETEQWNKAVKACQVALDAVDVKWEVQK